MCQLNMGKFQTAQDECNVCFLMDWITPFFLPLDSHFYEAHLNLK